MRGSIWRQTLPEVFNFSDVKMPCEWKKSEMILEFANGSEIWCGGLDDKERVEKILGQEFATISVEEVSQIPWQTIELLRTRLAQTSPGMRQLMILTCNPPPRSHWTYRAFRQGVDPGTNDALPNPELFAEMRMNPHDNLDNLAPEYIKDLENLPARQRTRFLEGEWGADNPYALWKQGEIDEHRIPVLFDPENPLSEIEAKKALILIREIRRIVVAVDPPTTSGSEADECGIIVFGIDQRGEGYVIDDFSSQGDSPKQWAQKVVRAFRAYDADLIVAEVNQGGEMVKETIQNVDPSMPIKMIHARRGKVLRAEPISTLAEEGKIHHLGTFLMLEQQLTDFTTDFDKKSAGYSPDRVDAMVYGATECFGLGTPIDLGQGIIEPDIEAPKAGWQL